MIFKPALAALVAVVHIRHACASPQATTVLPFDVLDGTDTGDDSGEGEFASGIIVGTNAEGATTYVFSAGGTATDEVAVTATLIEDASGATAIIELPEDDGAKAIETIACGFSDGNAECTQVLVGLNGTETILETTLVTSGVADSITLVVSTSAAASGSTGASVTGTSTSSQSSQSSAAGMNAAASFVACALSLVVAAVVYA